MVFSIQENRFRSLCKNPLYLSNMFVGELNDGLTYGNEINYIKRNQMRSMIYEIKTTFMVVCGIFKWVETIKLQMKMLRF